MKETLVGWFTENQLKLAFFVGCLCLGTVFLTGFLTLQLLFSFLLSLLFIFAGSKLHLAESSENWLKFSYSEILKDVAGGAFMLVGWAILLRGVLVSAIASLILRTI